MSEMPIDNQVDMSTVGHMSLGLREVKAQDINWKQMGIKGKWLLDGKLSRKVFTVTLSTDALTH